MCWGCAKAVPSAGARNCCFVAVGLGRPGILVEGDRAVAAAEMGQLWGRPGTLARVDGSKAARAAAWASGSRALIVEIKLSMLIKRW